MSWIYTSADYFGIVDDDYTKYISEKRAARGPLYSAGWQSIQTAKILLAGCGFGEMVQEMTDRGFTDVWGCDASVDGINEGKARFPAIANRLLVGDILDTSSMNQVKRDAGLRGQQNFRLIVTENVLPCMANELEVQACLTILRDSSQTLAHIISVLPDSEFESNYRAPDGSIRVIETDFELRMPGFIWENAAFWIAQINTPSEWIFTPALERIQ